jgi:hypothetical protein
MYHIKGSSLSILAFLPSAMEKAPLFSAGRLSTVGTPVSAKRVVEPGGLTVRERAASAMSEWGRVFQNRCIADDESVCPIFERC